MISNEFLSPTDGITLFRHVLMPRSAPRAIIVMAHGMLEHGGRHLDWAEIMVSQHQVALVLPDARGHGRSGGRPAWIERFDNFVSDYVQSLNDAANGFPNVPIYAMGFSMGGAIASLTALSENRPALAGLILAAPAIRFRGPWFGTLYRVASFLDHLMPNLGVARPGFNALSRDKELVRDYMQDPLVFHGKLRLHFATEILRAMKRIQRNAARLNEPLLVLQGTQDRVVTPEGADELVRMAESNDKTLHHYEGFYHALLHEPERDQVLQDLSRWLNERIV